MFASKYNGERDGPAWFRTTLSSPCLGGRKQCNRKEVWRPDDKPYS